MARAKKDAPIDLSGTHELSVGLIDRLTCPPGVAKAFLRDKGVPGLRVRVTANGAKSFVFEAKLNGKAISRTLGGFPLMSIGEAQDKARELAKTIKTDKKDPREIERQQREKEAAEQSAAIAKAEAERVEVIAKIEAAKVAAVTVGEAWTVYLAERRPRWGDLHYKDHVKLARAGGVKCVRGTDGRGVTIDMPLYPLMALPLRDLTAPVVESWASKEAQTRPTSARLAWRLLKGFLGWCAEQPAYTGLVTSNAAKTKRSREALGKPAVKKDALLREQLPAWFDAVQKIQNPIIAAALQVMLLLGARPNEVLSLRWTDLNTKWKGITIHDKVEGERIIPLTPYVWHLIATLPKRNELIFSSATAAAGALTAPRKHHVEACTTAGIDGLSLHGLRRSFKSLTEWLEIPVGVVAQIMGHKPSATAELHYTVRPLDLLRVHHEKIEAWILDQAGIVFDANVEPGKLRVVAG